ncbi:hypothetical protein BGW36DRAFT_429917 [Talaromyces proteolyticus]|uniref:Zn(2)-C6 fungal-type domain-containing protein n=1 Tax=Talaromyces proteolyticus TaxID=1131652 RepID=A0AAD4KMR8_9EURO|nr:uncharacterized protein BGW36DRAFT_429917 [Talaromyces proteolyticus]KAH8693890.1 hypothetical protein BGW36DRAFT_429917 [Talaromyces proteolyticus]
MNSADGNNSQPQRRRRGTRSVGGCLTCRRRRVKCSSRILPCDNCQRLKLSCSSSFHWNFKTWQPDSKYAMQSPSGSVNQLANDTELHPYLLPISHDPGSSACQGTGLQSNMCIDASNAADSDFNPNHDNIAANDLLMIPDINTESNMTSLPSLTPVARDNADEDVNQILELDAPSIQYPGSSLWAMPSLVTDDSALLDDQAAKMPWLLTVKQSAWNPYQFMLDTTRRNANSPLKHSILGWCSAYISCQSKSQLSFLGTFYYLSAADSLGPIIENLSTNNIAKSASIAESLYMLFSTAYFLNSCDLMLSDFRSYYERTDLIRVAVKENWAKIKENLGTLESRLLIWLAHFDLRYSLFSSRRSPDNLFNILVGLGAFPFLRSYPEGHSYLSPCFGNKYPRKELEEDLVQEPCHAMCDQIFAIMGRINAFASWNEEHQQYFEWDNTLKELRTAKIEVLQAQIAKIRAECALLMREQQDSKAIDRSLFHFLTVETLHKSATIMLNRVVEPDVRTDPESQEAATQIILITQRFRKLNYLQFPRSSHTWPLPIFIAGIEITDVIYQDWIITFLTELEPLGTHIRKTRDLLERITLEQEKKGKRVDVQYVMHNFDSVYI